MKKEIGLWIDHRKAVIVTINDGIEETQEIQSDVGKRVRFSGKNQAEGDLPDEDIRDRQYDNRLDLFYDEVIDLIKSADSILIIGPGEAKGEFKKRMIKAGFGECIVGVEAADSLTNNQIEAKIRDLYMN